MQGHVDTALEAFQESLIRLEEASRREVDNLEVLFQTAQTRFWLADVHYQRLDYAAARIEITHYRDLAERMVELEPETVDHHMEVAFAENNLGTLAFQTGQPVLARKHFLVALNIKQRLLNNDPQNRKLKGETTITMGWLGSVESNLGNISEAIDWHERQIDELEELLSQRDDMQYRDKLALAYRKHAEDFFRSNRINEAVIEERKPIIIYRDLVAKNPENAVWRNELNTSLLKLAEILLATGDISETTELLREAGEGLDRELAINPNNGRLQRERATVDTCWARLNLVKGNPANEYASSAMKRLRPLIKEPYDAEVNREFARAAYVLSASYKHFPTTDNSEEISAVTSEALQALDALQSSEAETIALQALLHASAGREDEARQIVALVLDTEYRAPEYLIGSPMSTVLYGSN